MTLTIELPPHVETRLRDEAARDGLDTGAFVLNLLEKSVELTRREPQHLSQMEAELLQSINEGLPPEKWQRYQELVAKRRAKSLTAEEHRELIELSDSIEETNARRIGHLVELAQLRNISLESLMQNLGISPPSGT